MTCKPDRNQITYILHMNNKIECQEKWKNEHDPEFPATMRPLTPYE